MIAQGVQLSDVYKTLQMFMGGVLVNYFNRFGRQWQVYVQAEGDYRTRAENLGQFYVTNDTGQPVPMSALTTGQDPAPGLSSPCAITSTAAHKSMAVPRPVTAQARR